MVCASCNPYSSLFQQGHQNVFHNTAHNTHKVMSRQQEGPWRGLYPTWPFTHRYHCWVPFWNISGTSYVPSSCVTWSGFRRQHTFQYLVSKHPSIICKQMQAHCFMSNFENLAPAAVFLCISILTSGFYWLGRQSVSLSRTKLCIDMDGDDPAPISKRTVRLLANQIVGEILHLSSFS